MTFARDMKHESTTQASPAQLIPGLPVTSYRVSIPFPIAISSSPFPYPSPSPIYVCLHLMRFLFKILLQRAPSFAPSLSPSPSLLLSVVAEGASLLPPSCCQRSRVHWTHFALTLTLAGAKKYVCVACVASLKFFPLPSHLPCTHSLSRQTPNSSFSFFGFCCCSCSASFICSIHACVCVCV